jgi:amino acid adenylation domain-containing protein
MNNTLTAIEGLFSGNILVTEADHPAYNRRCLHQLFEQQVINTPNNVAVISGNKTLTYNELNLRANKLSTYLTQCYDISLDKPIGIMLQRSELMIIGILASLKSGGAYVPIDPSNPIEYIQYICTDCDIDIVLTEGHVSDETIYGDVNFIDLTGDVYLGNGDNRPCTTEPTNLAYIIYTSGSTGKPKGVMIEHRSIVNKLTWMAKRYPLDCRDTVLQKTNFVFDVSVWEMLWPLICGARLCFLQVGAQMYPDKILNAIVQFQVTILHFVPPMLQIYLNYFELHPSEIVKMTSVKRVYTSGEALTTKQANIFNKLFYKRLGTGLTNQYGPTEAAIEVTYFDCEQEEELAIVPIGKPISNTELYIAGVDGDMLPNGETGELIIGGIQVARGYKNNPNLTDEKFILNPFSPSQKMYKTGDKARILPDGNIEFLGRIDDQVKVNGYRIEPGQIEHIILQRNSVNQCIVCLRSINDINELVAYIATKKDECDEGDLIGSLVADLKLKLPAHMIPAFFVKLDAFPTTSSGKVDRKKLPSPLHRVHNKLNQVTLPITHTQKVVTEIWEDALKVTEMSIDDNFFELGGRSLIVAKVIGLINNKFETKLSFTNLFQLPTIRELAYKIDHNHSEPLNPIVLVRPGIGAPLLMFPGMDSTPILFDDFQKHYNGTQPLYSILYPVMDSGFPFSDLQKYAEYIVTQMRMIVPQGPYGLMGYSLGGRLAFEVATQLQKLDCEVAMLAIVSAFPTRDITLQDGLVHWMKEKVKILANMEAKLALRFLTRRVPFGLARILLKPTKTKQKSKTEPAQISNCSHPLFIEAWEGYKTDRKFKGEILLITEDITHNGFSDYHKTYVYRDSYMGKSWTNHIDGAIVNYIMKCKHHDLFVETHVREVAEAVHMAWTN